MAQLVVMCGGYGRRMAAVTGGSQKCLVPVAARPFLAHVLAAATGGAVDRVLLLAGHRGDEVKAFADNLRRGPAGVPFELTVRFETRPRGPVAALRDAADLLAEGFAVALGDVLPPPGAGRLVTALADLVGATGAAAVMTVAPAAASQDPGNVHLGLNGPWISRFGQSRPGPFIDYGFRYLRRDCLDEHAGDGDREFFGRLAAARRLAYHLVDSPIVEVGTPDRWIAAEAALVHRGGTA